MIRRASILPHHLVLPRAFILAALAAFAILAFSRAAAAEEAITDFRSDISVSTDGTLSVRETITVHAEGDQIRHGIYRDFPTTYTDRMGNRMRVRFDVSDVERDGNPEHYEIEGIDNGKRVKIGDAGVVLDPGDYTYVIVYTTDRQIGFFDNYDELYWNVTGNGWVFPIEHAEATIHLPPEASVKQTAFYTGAQGAQGQDAEASVDPGGAVRFATTAPLAAEEGLTVAVGFSKGVITPPTEAEKRLDFLRDNASTGAALAGLAVLAAFYFFAWLKFGRDPAPGPIVPLFAPPKNFSAAAVRFVHRMAYDRKAFAAALIAMAVKGYLTIAETDSTYTLKRTGKSEGETGLARGETAIAHAFFSGNEKITLKNENHSAVASAIKDLHTALTNEYEKVYFVTNRGWFIAGLAIMGVGALAAALLSNEPAGAGFMLFWLSGWSVGTSFLLHRTIEEWRSVFIGGAGSRILHFFAAVFHTVFAAPFVGGIVFALFFLGASMPKLAMASLVLQGVLAYIFYHLLKAPTLLGARIRDEIGGFRMFLETAEKDRLEKLDPPQVTPEVFERFLPYAIALDAENAWSRKFEAEAARAGIDTVRGAYMPIWYSGSSFGRLGTAGFASAIGASVATAAAAASMAPGSSSGSGGGGFSGGGGGGGGGGGW